MKKYTHIIIFLFLFIGIVAAIAATVFLAKKIHTALDTQERIKLEREIQKEQIENLPELAKLHAAILEKEQYFTLLYSEDRLVEVIQNIEEIAKGEGITLTITQKEVSQKKASQTEDSKSADKKSEEKPKTLEESLPYEKHVRLELKANGSYVAIRNFLHKLETAPYALDVLSFTATLAPPEEEASRQPTRITGTPFLLGSNVPAEEETAAPSGQNKVAAVIETALYIK